MVRALAALNRGPGLGHNTDMAGSSQWSITAVPRHLTTSGLDEHCMHLVHMHICMHYMHTYMHAHMHAHICMHTCTHMWMHTCMHTYMHTCIHICIHIGTCS